MRFCVVLWALLVAACQGTPPVIQPELVVETHGMVFLQPHELAGGSNKNRAHNSLVLVHHETGKEHVLNSYNYETNTHNRTVSGWLPAGAYTPARFNGRKLRGYPDVRVTAGHLVNLGGWFVFDVGNYDVIVLPRHHREISARAAEMAAAPKNLLINKKPIDWHMDSVPEPTTTPGQNAFAQFGIIGAILGAIDREVGRTEKITDLRDMKDADQLFATASANRPFTSDEPAVDLQGTLCFGADLGHVKCRDRAGTWTSLNTGRIELVSAVEAGQGHLLAGFKDGKLLARTDQQTWVQVADFGAGSDIADIDFVDNQWIVTTVQEANIPDQQQYRIELHATNDPMAWPTPEKLSFDIKRERWMPLISRSEAAKGGYFLAAYPKLYRIDLENWLATDVSPPFKVTGVRASVSSNLLTAYEASGVFSDLAVSNDQGTSWQDLKTPPHHIADVQFETAGDGLALRTNVGAFSVSLERLAYSAKTKKWRNLDEIPKICTLLARGVNNRQQYCTTTAGSVLASTPDGWRVEKLVGAVEGISAR